MGRSSIVGFPAIHSSLDLQNFGFDGDLFCPSWTNGPLKNQQKILPAFTKVACFLLTPFLSEIKKHIPLRYDAFRVGEGGGGGEYVPQTGFGWSNGVAMVLRLGVEGIGQWRWRNHHGRKSEKSMGWWERCFF